MLPNFVKDVPNFLNDVLRVPKCVLRWGSAPKHFLMGSKMKLCTIHVQMGILEAIGSDVPNLMKDVTKFFKGCTKFFEWCTKGSKVRVEVRIGPQTLSYVFQNEIMYHPCSNGGPGSDRIGCTKFCEGCVKLLRWGLIHIMWEVSKREVGPLTPSEGIRTFTLYP